MLITSWLKSLKRHVLRQALHGRTARRAKHCQICNTPAVELLEDRALLAAALTAELDEQAVGTIEAGDGVTYLGTITNTGDLNATNVVLSDPLDPNTSFVSGSFNVGVAAFPDAFDVLGNTPRTLNAEGGLLANDVDLDAGGAFTVTGVTDIGGTATDGTLVPATDGGFTYTPAVGAAGTDIFRYNVLDSDGLISTGTVTFMISGMVWYVDGTAGAGGDGSFANPFDEFTELDAGGADPDAAGDTIFVFDSAVNDSITLEDNQSLIGEGVGLSATLNGANTQLIAPGTRPVLTTASGNAITLASAGNTVRGLNVGNTPGYAILGTGFGTATVDNVSVTGSGGIIRAVNGTLNATFDAVTSTSSTSAPINLGNLTGGTINFAGQTTINSGNQDAISAVSSNTTTVNFTGGLDVDTTTGKGIVTANLGTLSITGANNTIDSVGDRAVDIQNTTLAAAGVTLRSVSANGGDFGIILVNTGNTGFFTVTGDGSTATQGGNDSGGVIQNTNTGVRLTAGVHNVTLQNMTIGNTAATPANGPNGTAGISQDGILADNVTGLTLNNITVAETGQDAIHAQSVTNFVMNDSHILNAGNGNEEHGIDFNELRGDNFIRRSLFDGYNETGVEVINTSGSVDITIDDTTFQDNQSTVGNVGEQAILLIAQGSANIVAKITGTAGVGTDSVFDDMASQAVHAISEGASSDIQLTVENSRILESNAGDAMIIMNTDNGGTGNITVRNNFFTDDTFGAFAVIVKNDSSGLLEATIDNNVVTNAQLLNVNHDDVGSGGAANGTTRVSVTNNIIAVGSNNIAIDVIATESPTTGSAPDLSLNITGNTSTQLDGNFTFTPGLRIAVQDSSRVNAHISGNSFQGAPTFAGGSGIEISEADSAVVNLQGFAGGNVAAIQAFIDAANPGSSAASFVSSHDSNFGGGAPTLPSATTMPNPLMIAPPSGETVTPFINNAPHTINATSTGNGLSQAELDAAVDEAIARWTATGLDADQIADLEAVDVQVGSLSSLIVGLQVGSRITIDDNGGGFGWFIDSTISEDSEFTNGVANIVDAANRVDLLTVVMHEFGHVLGADHSDTGLMAETLTLGSRINPDSNTIGSGIGEEGPHALSVAVTPPGGGTGLGNQGPFTLPLGSSVQASFTANLTDGPGLPNSVSAQSTITSDGGISVMTDDPATGAADDATVTDVVSLTLGGTVWNEQGANAVFNSGTDTGINGVTVRLYLDDGDNVLDAGDGAAIATTTTSNMGGQDGRYEFTNIADGNYIVEVVNSTGPLAGLTALPGAVDPDNNVDNDNNGSPVAGFETATNSISLAYNQEPTAGPGNNTNNTVDLGFEDAGEDTIVEITGNNLVITDDDGTIDNEFVLTSDGTTLTIVDNSGATIDVSGVPGSTGTGTSTVTVPYAAAGFTGAIIINGSGGDDSLEIDYSSGTNFAGRAITFNGQGQDNSPNGDELILTGGTFVTNTYNYTNANDGTIQLTGQGLITYTGLEPITSTITATNVNLNYSAAAETITVTDAGGGQTTVNSTAGEITTFNNPSGSVNINAGNTGDDIVNITSLAANYPANLGIDGGTGADTINVNGAVNIAAGGSFTAIAETINVNTAQITAGNSLNYTGSVNLLTDTTMTAVAGVVTFDGNVNGAQALDIAGRLDVGGNNVSQIGNTAPLTSLQVSGNTTFQGTALPTVTTTGLQTYTGEVLLFQNTTLTSNSGGDITLGGTVNGGRALIVNTSGTTTFTGEVGGTTPLLSLQTDAGGETVVNDNVTTTTTQEYQDAVTFAGDVTLTGTFVDFLGGNTIAIDGTTPTTAATLEVAADLTLGNGETLELDFFNTTPGTQHDQIDVTGTVDINNATLNIDDTGFMAAGNETFVLINNDGADAVTGTFNGLAEGAIVAVGGENFAITYAGGDGNDVVLNEFIPLSTHVINTNDGGTGSLRQAIANAEINPGPDTITFSDGTGGTHNFHDATPDVITLGGTQLEISSDITITGPGADLLTVSGDDSSRVFDIANGDHDVTLDSLTVTEGSSISTVTAGSGGGIRNRSTGTVTITDAIVSDNSSSTRGGGIFHENGILSVERTIVRDNSTSSSGGGIFIQSGDARISTSTISGNRTLSSSPYDTSGGGGIFSTNNSSLTVTNSSISGNSTSANVKGGGGIDSYGSLTIGSSTISGNTAAFGGGIRHLGSPPATINNSIVSGNMASFDDEINGSNTANSSLIGIPNELTLAEIIDTTLADNGGPTPTHALVAGSPAINAGDNTLATDTGLAGGADLNTDQRGTGFDRIIDGTVDIGALESEALASPPQAPENVIAADTETLRPTISWDAEPNATSYGIWFIKLAEGATPGSVVAGQSGLTSLSFTPDADLVEGNYSVWVRSINAAGASTWSIPATFRIGSMVTIPAAPASVTVVDATVARPTIEWTPSADATSYGIWFINLAGGVVAGQTGLTGTSFTPDSDLTPGDEYRVYVRAMNSAGVSGWSEPLNFISGPTITVPDAPANVTVVDTNTPRPTVQWDAAATATSYGIWFINLAGGVVAGQSGLTDLSFTPAVDVAEGEYSVYIRAFNAAGPSDWSIPATFRVGPMETIPPAPLNLTATNIETAQPTILWDNVPDAMTYGIWFINLAGGIVAGQSGLTETAFETPETLDEGNYRVWVRSFNSAGVSDWSTPLDITITSPAIVKLESSDTQPDDDQQPLDLRLRLFDEELTDVRMLTSVANTQNPQSRSQQETDNSEPARSTQTSAKRLSPPTDLETAFAQWANHEANDRMAHGKPDVTHSPEDDLMFPFLATVEK